MNKLDWDNLLSGIRLRDKQVKDRTEGNEFDLRNDFEDDYGRLIFSSAVRRLQDKAQVFPLDDSDFIRTRLTHSHEVSSIGRSIGKSVEENLIKNKTLRENHRGKLSSLLAVVGLVHDLGNPPYGHFGEIAIQNFFKNWFKITKAGREVAESIGEAKVADFENFEGNAQTFRLLTKLHNLKDEFGYNLSAASLASILKYPRSSIEGNKSNQYRKDNELGVSYKKFGYLQSESDRFNQVRMFTGLKGYRHPVTFLLEAADDIAYSAADLEDGCKKNVLDYQTIVDILSKHLLDGNDYDQHILNSFKREYEENKRSDRLDNAVQKLRIMAQGYMIKSIVKEFLIRQEDILLGEFDEEIIDVSDAKRLRKAFKDLARVIFDDKDIIIREYTGGRVIEGLLEMFVEAVISEERNDTRTKQGKLYLLISKNYKDIMYTHPYETVNGEPSLYDRLLLVTDFVCGMTDTYALDLYRRLTGIKL